MFVLFPSPFFVFLLPFCLSSLSPPFSFWSCIFDATPFPFPFKCEFLFSHRQRNRFLLLPFFFLPSSEMPLPFVPFCAKCRRLSQRETNEIASSSNRGRRQVRLSSGMLCVKKLMVGMSRVQYKKDVNTGVEQEKTTHHTCAVSAFFHLLSV